MLCLIWFILICSALHCERSIKVMTKPEFLSVMKLSSSFQPFCVLCHELQYYMLYMKVPENANVWWKLITTLSLFHQVCIHLMHFQEYKCHIAVEVL